MSIHSGDAIGQLLIVPIYTPSVMEVSLNEIHENDSSRRNTGGIVDQFSSLK